MLMDIHQIFMQQMPIMLMLKGQLNRKQLMMKNCLNLNPLGKSKYKSTITMKQTTNKVITMLLKMLASG